MAQNKWFLIVAIVALLITGCKKEDDSGKDENNSDAEPRFQTLNFFSGTIEGMPFSVIEENGTFFKRVDGYSSPLRDTSLVRFGGIYIFSDVTAFRQIAVFFAKSYADTSLLLNDGFSFNSDVYSNRNPFTRANDFHDIFKIGGRKPFFYSEDHMRDHIPRKLYNGLVVELTINSRRWVSNKNFQTDSRNSYEIVKYQKLRENATPNGDGTYNLSQGRVRIKFDCYLEEVNGNNKVHIESGEFQGVIN